MPLVVLHEPGEHMTDWVPENHSCDSSYSYEECTGEETLSSWSLSQNLRS